MDQPRVLDGQEVLGALRARAAELGFSQIGVADVDLSSAEAGLMRWLAEGFHGGMHYMAAHGLKRARPRELVPGTVRVVTARMNYLPRGAAGAPAGGGGDWRAVEWRRLESPAKAAVSMYARGRDYHKVLRARLQQLAAWLAGRVGPLGFRVFTDSAPVLEVELASRSGIGWRGKHTLTLHREAGSMFFLGEIYIDLPLPLTPPVEPHCGSCRACIDVCPTQAILGPYRLDARRCISYLTMEPDGRTPAAAGPLMGNRVYGCDDSQLVCPWNKYAQSGTLPDFDVRSHLSDPTLLSLWAWTEAEFLGRTEGSAIRRIGFERWRRNLAVALGNALGSAMEPVQASAIRKALNESRDAATPMVREHIDWALSEHADRP